MPSTSARQHRLMEAALHDKKVREETGIPEDVAEDYVNADKRKQSFKKAADSQAMTLEMYELLHRRL